jgi:hypothetical protein
VLLQRALTRAERDRRFWRRTAAVVAAALVLVVAASLLRVEVHDSRVVFAWGEVPERSVPASAPQPDLARIETRLDEHDALFRLIGDEFEADDRAQERAMLAVFARLRRLQEQNDTRWRTVQHLFRTVAVDVTDASERESTRMRGEGE